MVHVSAMAESLSGSEIIGLANRVKDLIRQGRAIDNLTIGDFDPKIFPIPSELTEGIIRAYRAGYTSYPAADGILELRSAVAAFIENQQQLKVDPNQIVIAAGARPLILATYMTVIDPGDTIVYPVPSWNNNHYVHLMRGKGIAVETSATDRFMPTASELAPHLKGARLLALCSPLNPTGTTFSKAGLGAICDLVLEENARRGPNEKPLFLMYDQIYSMLTAKDAVHVDPIGLRPEMREFTVFVDGISKSMAATGVRVGWGFGPPAIVSRMKPILSHVGAWAPHAEQVACAEVLANAPLVGRFLSARKAELAGLLDGFHRGFQSLAGEGHPVASIAPEGAIYLTVKIDLVGRTTPSGTRITSVQDTFSYLLEAADVALVPFSSFGAPADWPWFRLSVGTATRESVERVIGRLRAALARLSK